MNSMRTVDPQYDTHYLRAFLESEMGFDLASVKLDELISSLHRTSNIFDSFEHFASAVASSIAVHETYFLRHREQFDWIESVWLPRVIENHVAGEPVCILSGGCATGEEPYSLYAHLAPHLERFGIALEVDALDVSQNALDKARQGRYGLWSLRGVVMESEQDWLAVESRSVQVKDWVKQGVVFRKHNLTQAMPLNRSYDLILCRNVMIYMHQVAITRTLCNLSAVLKPDGFIVPGPSDPNPPEELKLDVCWNHGCRVFVHRNSPVLSFIKSAGDKASRTTAHGVHPDAVNTGHLAKDAHATHSGNALWMPDYALVESLIRSGHYDGARSLLEDNINRNPMDVRSYIMLGMLALDLDDVVCAEHAARKAAYLEPDALFTVYLIANVKLRTGDKEAAYSEFMWVWQRLKSLPPGESIKYCEDITVEQFMEVVRARLA